MGRLAVVWRTTIRQNLCELKGPPPLSRRSTTVVDPEHPPPLALLGLAGLRALCSVCELNICDAPLVCLYADDSVHALQYALEITAHPVQIYIRLDALESVHVTHQTPMLIAFPVLLNILCKRPSLDSCCPIHV